MTLHLVSVGSNLVDALSAPSGISGLDPDLADAIRDESPARVLSDTVGSDNQAAAVELGACLSPGTDQHRYLAQLTQAVKPGLWPSGISAELDTLTRVPGGRRHLAAGSTSNDVAVLLATDTVDGLTAALWNALALTEGDLDRVEYLPSPAELPSAPRGRALVVRVPGLDAHTEGDFTRAMEGLGTLGRTLVTKVADSGDEDFLFHLSGGYKAAVPYLIGLAEGLRSLRRTGTVQAFMLHRDTLGKPIRLPLRRMRIEVLHEVLHPFRETGKTPCSPGNDVLEGYAYDLTDSGDYELTAFGAGLLALIGRPEEPLGL
ncbi:hypothetical protein [Streptomyces cyanogenus]|uniref:CRISPR-associated protein n=1 Tax=Streptomyces cyanogenus TaxID=80860 RepID=A0ABX7TX55_STRCY|nr:hypothetical protein [Streptomyces cyanogenus]QTD99991.1 CRISPR-associated protein [Streptomyces cyanogenus]